MNREGGFGKRYKMGRDIEIIQISDKETFKKMLMELVQIKYELKNMAKNLVMVNNALMRVKHIPDKMKREL